MSSDRDGLKSTLTFARQQPFAETPAFEIKEVQTDLYRRVLEIMVTVEDSMRQWSVSQAIFEYALFQMHADQSGLAIRYGHLGPDRADGIHSLYETVMYGSSPWSSLARDPVYWGSMHLAGWAAACGRMQVWDVLSNDQGLPIDNDEYEQSACASPVIRAGRLAGVLLFSSARPGFFINPLARQAVHEYALLLTLAFDQQDFKPFSRLNLHVMPNLKWQREEMKRVYIGRVLAYASEQHLPWPAAEARVREEMELEFETQ